MQDKAYYLTLLVIAGCSIAVTYHVFSMPDPDFPSSEDVLKAIENGAANLTVTPVVQSDN